MFSTAAQFGGVNIIYIGHYIGIDQFTLIAMNITNANFIVWCVLGAAENMSTVKFCFAAVQAHSHFVRIALRD